MHVLTCCQHLLAGVVTGGHWSRGLTHVSGKQRSLIVRSEYAYTRAYTHPPPPLLSLRLFYLSPHSYLPTFPVTFRGTSEPQCNTHSSVKQTAPRTTTQDVKGHWQKKSRIQVVQVLDYCLNLDRVMGEAGRLN